MRGPRDECDGFTSLFRKQNLPGKEEVLRDGLINVVVNGSGIVDMHRYALALPPAPNIAGGAEGGESGVVIDRESVSLGRKCCYVNGAKMGPVGEVVRCSVFARERWMRWMRRLPYPVCSSVGGPYFFFPVSRSRLSLPRFFCRIRRARRTPFFRWGSECRLFLWSGSDPKASDVRFDFLESALSIGSGLPCGTIDWAYSSSEFPIGYLLVRKGR